MLDGIRKGKQWYVTGGSGISGYAQYDPATGSAQMCVHPKARRRGIGAALAKAVLAKYPNAAWWAFGSLDSAAALAQSLGFSQARHLLLMRRELTADDPPARPVPEGLQISSFWSADAERIVELNSAAFSKHPEQGQLTLEDLKTATEDVRFENRDLLVGKLSDHIVGYHWMKRHSPTEGEVYVLAVDPDFHGRGIGRALLEAGLEVLRERGVTKVHLYVESDSESAIALYDSARFTVSGHDTQYASKHSERPSS
ncbi:MAG: mycothiol synthase [Propionibacterium sp.]|nr:MAG: mycothiol synthase [Propionibacterium sp.]